MVGSVPNGCDNLVAGVESPFQIHPVPRPRMIDRFVGPIGVLSVRRRIWASIFDTTSRLAFHGYTQVPL